MSAMEVVAECPSFFITNNKLCLCLPISAYSLIVLSCYSTSLKPEYSSAFVDWMCDAFAASVVRTSQHIHHC